MLNFFHIASSRVGLDFIIGQIIFETDIVSGFVLNLVFVIQHGLEVGVFKLEAGIVLLPIHERTSISRQRTYWQVHLGRLLNDQLFGQRVLDKIALLGCGVSWIENRIFFLLVCQIVVGLLKEGWSNHGLRCPRFNRVLFLVD